jgi:predicted  nucleic acid-binding Zn-ribbon protein
MHPEIVALCSLLEVDAEMEQIRSALEELSDAVKKGSTEVGVVEDELKQLLEELAENEQSTRAVRRKCADYTRKRDKTRAMIDEGRAPDFFVAEKQFKQCAEIVDELEFEELELMESREEMEIHQRSLDLRLAERREGYAQAVVNQREQRPPQVARYRELQPLKTERKNRVPRFLHSAYDSLRQQERAPLVRLDGDTCSHCHLGAPPQMVIEIRTGKRPHICRGCSAWLLPSLELEEEAG